MASIEAAYQAGVTHFGENYLQEAQTKIPALAHLPLQWHFFGAIQSNKTRWIAEHFDWVHTVERVKIAQRLSDQRGAEADPLNLLLQVNVDADPNKAGCAPHEVETLLTGALELENLRIRGLMTMLNKTTDPEVGYQKLAMLFKQLGSLPRSGDWDTLSMGMSADYVSAIRQGATMVRVGTALFGSRDT